MSIDGVLHPAEQLHRETTGSGEPVVLSHGLGDDASTFAELVPLLAMRQTVHSWDLRGHRHSGAPPDGYRPDVGVADLLGIVDDIGEPVHLVGHSLGGYLSLTVALQRPDLVRSLTLIASGPGYRDPEARDAWNRYVDDAVLRMPIPPEVAGLARQEDSWVIDQTPQLATPLLVIVGERDTRFLASAAYLGRAVDGATVVRVAGAGHHPQRSHPDQVATAILDHLDRRS
jgi:pimeloyl-ACP methyl ester carboxylesterase